MQYCVPLEDSNYLQKSIPCRGAGKREQALLSSINRHRKVDKNSEKNCFGSKVLHRQGQWIRGMKGKSESENGIDSGGNCLKKRQREKDRKGGCMLG